MKGYRWPILLGTGLLAVSAGIYILQIGIFRSPRDTFFYLFQDLAFIPFQVLLVTLILNRVLTIREKQSMLRKMNMVIGAFFSEVGTDLLRLLAQYDLEPARVISWLEHIQDWPVREFAAGQRALKDLDLSMDSRRGDLAGLKAFLLDRRIFLLRLLENPNLLEHEAFTELLWGVFHLTDELAHRPGLHGLPEKDYDHLSLDIRRAYGLLLVEWLAYLGHLKVDYPYLYSLAVRTNPFDASASVVIGG